MLLKIMPTDYLQALQNIYGGGYGWQLAHVAPLRKVRAIPTLEIVGVPPLDRFPNS